MCGSFELRKFRQNADEQWTVDRAMEQDRVGMAATTARRIARPAVGASIRLVLQSSSADFRNAPAISSANSHR
jgi:hypothetical protein